MFGVGESAQDDVEIGGGADIDLDVSFSTELALGKADAREKELFGAGFTKILG